MGVATSYQLQRGDAPHSPSSSPGSGRRKTAEGPAIDLVSGTTCGDARGSPPTIAPMDGFHVVPQQEEQETLSGVEEGGNWRSLLWVRDAGTASPANVQNEVSLLNDHQHSQLASGGVDGELLITPPSAIECRRWSVACGRRTLAALRFVCSTARITVTLFAAFLAILVTFWALTPVCTSCVRSRDGPTSRVAPAADESSWSTLRINQLQVIGTHNSYHQHTYIPALSEYWDYHYPSLTTQLNAGVRHLELDIHYDWKTGRWFVFHLSVLDPMSSCHCLSVCLEEIREWSDAHPTHHILFIEVELKLTGDFLQLCGQKTPDADHAAFREMQETVVREFSRERILTPRDVRGDYETLTEAVNATSYAAIEEERASTDGGTAVGSLGGSGSNYGLGGDTEGEVEGGWPLVDDSRGKVLFIMDYQSTNRLCRPAIRKALPDDDTVFFERTPVDEIYDTPRLAFVETGFVSVSDDLVRSGAIVRDGDGPRTSYIVNSSVQLMVWDDLRAVDTGTSTVQGDDGSISVPLPCKSRCSALVPEEQCVLEGFC